MEGWRVDLLQAGIKENALDGRIALLASALEYFPRDLADRFIASTALYYEALLITADKRILDWLSGTDRHKPGSFGIA